MYTYGVNVCMVHVLCLSTREGCDSACRQPLTNDNLSVGIPEDVEKVTMSRVVAVLHQSRQLAFAMPCEVPLGPGGVGQTAKNKNTDHSLMPI